MGTTYSGKFWHSCIDDFEDNGEFPSPSDRRAYEELFQDVQDLFDRRKAGELTKQKYHAYLGSVIQHLAWSRTSLEATYVKASFEAKGQTNWSTHGQLLRVIRKAKLARLRMHARGKLWSTDRSWREEKAERELNRVVDEIVGPAVIQGFGAF